MVANFPSFKAVAAAAALLASQVGFAASTFQSGTLNLTFTDSAVTLSGIVGLVVSATPGSSTTFDTSTATASQDLTSAAFSATGDVTDLSAANAGLTFSIGTDKVLFSNFDIDLTTSKLYADVAVSLDGSSYQHQALFDIATLSQQAAAPVGLTVTTTVSGSGLTIDSAASSTWLAALLTAAGASGTSLNLSSLQFATFKADVISTTAAPVPEPSTYVLMGLGLAACGLIARRRQAA